MNYTFIVYNKQNQEKVGEIRTNHSISLDDAIELLDAERIEVVNSDDADLMINGKEVWSNDLDMMLEEEYLDIKTGKWLDTNIDVVAIDGALYALDGWNGEKYGHCWKCIDRFTADVDGREYVIVPVYDWEKWSEEEGAFIDADGAIVDGVIGYKVL